MKELLMPLIQQVLLVLVTVGVGFVIALLQKKFGIEKMKKFQIELESKKTLVSIAIKFIQQAYEDLDGEEKLELAMDWISEEFAKKGMNVSDEEIEGLIESTLKELKLQFKDSWKKAVERNK